MSTDELFPVDGNPRKFVRVIWWDATDKDETWVKDADIPDFGDSPTVVISFGYVVHDTTKYITLAADAIPELTTWGRVTKIPKGMVQSIDQWGQI